MIVACPSCLLRYDLTGRKVGTSVRCRCGSPILVPTPGPDAQALACPTCGAGVAPDRTRCDYCHAVLATVACPACLSRVFTGSPHCGHCGAAMDAGAYPPVDAGGDGNATERHCPRCPRKGRALASRRLATLLLEECHGCGGVWIDADSFARIIRERDQRPMPPELAHFHTAVDADAPPPPSSLGRHYIPCPQCGDLMNQKNFGEWSGVIIDFCKPHGFWFDQDELGKIVTFVSNGGLEETRRRERERRLSGEHGHEHGHAPAVGLAPILVPHQDGSSIGDFIEAIRWMASFLQ